MGIHRINSMFIEEFDSPGDLRFRIETDVRVPQTPDSRAFLRRLHNAADSSQLEAVRDLLLERLQRPVLKGEKISAADLIRVRRMIIGALSDPRKPLPPEAPATFSKRR